MCSTILSLLRSSLFETHQPNTTAVFEYPSRRTRWTLGQYYRLKSSYTQHVEVFQHLITMCAFVSILLADKQCHTEHCSSLKREAERRGIMKYYTRHTPVPRLWTPRQYRVINTIGPIARYSTVNSSQLVELLVRIQGVTGGTDQTSGGCSLC